MLFNFCYCLIERIIEQHSTDIIICNKMQQENNDTKEILTTYNDLLKKYFLTIRERGETYSPLSNRAGLARDS